MQEKILEAVNSALNQKEIEQQLQEQQEQISFLTEKNRELSVKFTILFLLSIVITVGVLIYNYELSDNSHKENQKTDD